MIIKSYVFYQSYLQDIIFTMLKECVKQIIFIAKKSIWQGHIIYDLGYYIYSDCCTLKRVFSVNISLSLPYTWTIILKRK